MQIIKTIQRIFFSILWIAMGCGLLVLLVAAIDIRKRQLCSDYVIGIKGVQNNFFVDEKDVMNLLGKSLGGKIRGQAMNNFNLMKLEQLLEENVWIQDAELYFDNHDVLHIGITEREPVARIFTTDGNSFYLDRESKRMPLSENLSARVPVFTGFPENRKWSSRDSVLVDQVIETADFILSDPFWMAQVSQVDIMASGKMEMIPTVGNHIVKLGKGEKVAAKFRRLHVFYKQVLSKAGFDRYGVIDVQYEGQVLGMKNQEALTQYKK